MPTVKIRDNEPFDVALRRFKRACEKAGILAEIHRREFYEKPTQMRKRKAAAAVKRWQKKVSRTSIATTPQQKLLKQREGAVRLISAAIKQREVDERITLDDARTLAALEKMIKQRKESIAQYSQARRQDLVDHEARDMQLIESYLPAQPSEAEVDAAVAAAVAETGAAGIKDIGRVMAVLKPKLAGKADMGTVSAKVRQRLS